MINFKWTTWAHRYLRYELVAYCAWLTAFTAFSLLFQDEDTSMGLVQLLDTPRGMLSLLCNVLCLCALVPFMYMDYCTVVVYGRGWYNIVNVMDIASYVLQVRYIGRPKLFWLLHLFRVA